MSLGVSLSQSGHVLPNKGKPPSIHQQQRSVNKKKNTRGLRDNSISTDISQATLDTQAREAIKDLFPKIPDKDLHEIICRAFQKVWTTLRFEVKTLSSSGERSSRHGY